MRLLSGLHVADVNAALEYLRQNYCYFDAVPVRQDSLLRVEEIFLQTMVNSRISGNTASAVFDSRAAVETALRQIPADLDLIDVPGVGKSHAACAIGNALIEQGHSVLFRPAYQLAQELLAAKRDLVLPQKLCRLDSFDLLILDDIGNVKQSPEEAEVLFTLIAERYERRSC